MDAQLQVVRGEYQQRLEESVAIREQLTAVIAEKDGELVRQRDLLTVKGGEITGHIAAVAEKDAQLDAHRVAIAEKDGELVRQRDLLTVKDGEITGYVAAVAEKAAQIDAHRVAIAEKDGEIENLQQQLANAKDTIESFRIQTKTHASGA